MIEIWLYTLLSILIVSLVSLVGLFTISIKKETLQKFLIYLISFSAGALFAGAFLHLLPEASEGTGLTIRISSLVLFGIVLFFSMEKIIHWQHCHMPFSKGHIHSFAIMNLIGDGFHNFLDGLIIGASYLINIPTGIATTIAVGLHEIPQEIGDFGILLHGGFSKNKALLFNLMSALIAVIGGAVALSLNSYIDNLGIILSAIAAGGFIYIAGSDLIPELHKDFTTKKALIQLIMFVLGMLLIGAMLLLE